MMDGQNSRRWGQRQPAAALLFAYTTDIKNGSRAEGLSLSEGLWRLVTKLGSNISKAYM